MNKEQRDSTISRLSQSQRSIFRQMVQQVLVERKSASSKGLTARKLLEARLGALPSDVQSALAAVIARDEMGPAVGELAPDFNLKLLGSLERVRLSTFRGKRPVALVFGSYT